MTHEKTQSPPRRPNILWITTHDINPHLGCYAGAYPGAEHAVTPHLDDLASEGLRFDNAFASAPICAPSRSAIITGCHPASIGTIHMRSKAVPPAGVRMFTEHFREAGYYVTNNSFTDFQMATPSSAFDECSDTAHWRDRPDPDQPFFATFHGLITHESQIHLDEESFEERVPHVRLEDRHAPEDVELPPYYPDTQVFRVAWARYLDLIGEMDHWVGTILQQLEDDGLAQSTIVVFWSDHGRGMPRAKRWANDSGLHEPLIIRWPGRITPGARTEALVHLMDLAPSMLAAAGLEVPDHMQARPFLDSSGRLDEHTNDYVFASRDRMGDLHDMSRTVRDSRYRYIRHYHPDRSPMQHCTYPDGLSTWAEMRRLATAEVTQRAIGDLPSSLTPLQRTLVAPSKPEEELYDLLEDPHEEHDLAGDREHAETLARLSTALTDWQEQIGDLGFLTEDELQERWRPGGDWPRTPEPEVVVAHGAVEARCSESSATIIWTDDPPAAHEPEVPPSAADSMGSPRNAIGSPVPDGRAWRIHCAASPIPADRPAWVRAVRLGWQPSADVAVAVAVGS
ncbi:sulfatase family protein [Brachybacterium subflavum]|uniref:sulfatase family protein n=1 Tax=Brachybacterium subflavum TaxID=2585206 RepID=UPI0012664191|nr:sulfatase [Brachybacterium subflavum]